MDTNRNERITVGRACAWNQDWLALGIVDTITAPTLASETSSTDLFEIGTYPLPFGLTPARTPNCGMRSTGTSLLTGTDDTEAASTAAAKEAAVEYFIVLKVDYVRGGQESE